MSEHLPDPRRIDLRSFARLRASIEGSLGQADLPRLRETLLPTPAAEPVVHWSARGESRPVKGADAQVWLHLEARMSATLQCQRCLQPLSAGLTVERSFLFVEGQAQASQLDEEIDEDVLVLSRAFDVMELLEDELILALPLVPRHDICPDPLPTQAADDFDEPRPHPFAALAALRKPPRVS